MRISLKDFGKIFFIMVKKKRKPNASTFIPILEQIIIIKKYIYFSKELVFTKGWSGHINPKFDYILLSFKRLCTLRVSHRVYTLAAQIRNTVNATITFQCYYVVNLECNKNSFPSALVLQCVFFANIGFYVQFAIEISSFGLPLSSPCCKLFFRICFFFCYYI